MTKLKSIVLLLFALASLSDASTRNDSSAEALGSFCNPIQGCGDSSLICLKNQCECAPGYAKSTSGADQCDFVGCEQNADCQVLDPNRRCRNSTCDQCKNGLVLDPTVNRCVTLLGNVCTHSSECWGESSLPRDYDSMPICRSGRCVCRTNYFPSGDWSACELRNCSSKDECNPFGDDPHRYCSKSQRSCQCTMGYYASAAHSVCLPYIPIQYSLMMPFWLTMIMFTVCILVYISRRLARARAEANAEAAAAAQSEESAAVPHALNLPPPSYETVVKEPAPTADTNETESQPSPPPTYCPLSDRQRQA